MQKAVTVMADLCTRDNIFYVVTMVKMRSTQSRLSSAKGTSDSHSALVASRTNGEHL